MSPLIEDLLGFGITALPTVAQGDCCLGVMAYWDGRDRTPKQWNSLRLEIGAAIEGLASGPQRHKVFVACAELPFFLPEALVIVAPPDSRPTATPPTGRAETSAALAACTDPGKLELAEQSEMAAATAYFCGGRCSETALDVGVLTMQLSLAERFDFVQGYRSLN